MLIITKCHKETFFDCRRMNFMCKESDIRDGIREIFRVADMDIPFSRDYFDMNVEEKSALESMTLEELEDYKLLLEANIAINKKENE